MNSLNNVRNNSVKIDNNKLIVLAISGLFGLIVAAAIYYIAIGNSKSRMLQSLVINSNSQTNPTDQSILMNNTNTDSYNLPSPIPSATTLLSAPVSTQSSTVLKPSNAPQQVFNIKQNKFTLSDAPAVCKLFGADVATIEQLQDAHAQGADWCNVGWTKEGLAAFPIQQSTWETLQQNSDPNARTQCGVPGINLVNNNPNMMYGVNCYGIKPQPRGEEKVMQKIQSDADLLEQQKLSKLRKEIDNINVMPFNQETWCYGSV